MRVHEERRSRLQQMAALDSQVDWHEIYRRLTLWELPAEARFGFQLAFYRPLAVPRMAKVLHGTGHLRNHTMRRAYDTAIVMHEIIVGGVDSERGQRMVRLLNKIHARPGIEPPDMAYVLDALIVVPTRFMDRYGWRRVSPSERQATWRFYNVLGERMGIESRPSSYDDSVARLTAYEAVNLAPSKPGDELTGISLRALSSRLPRPVRPWAAQLTSALVDDREVSLALGLPPASRPLQVFLTAGATLRRTVERGRRPPSSPSFTPGQAAGQVYPRGYDLEQIGPEVA